MSSDWSVPTWPHDLGDVPDVQASLTRVTDAYLTPVKQGPLRTVVRPTRWVRGAVHDADGRLVPASQKVGGLGGNQLAQADPRRVEPRPRARRLTGHWLYGGHWIGHFGHFFTETITTLWPARDELPDVDGLVFHRYTGAHAGLAEWQLELVDLAGWSGLPIEVVDGAPRWVDVLHVPTRAVVVNGWAHEGARAVWERVVAHSGAPTTPAPRKVYVSRTDFNAARRGDDKAVRTDAERDRALDAVFAEAGFAVVAPETLSVREQVRLAAGAAVIAGCAGTALHLTAFAPAGTRVIEIGDSRSPTVQVPQQRVIDRLLDHPSAFVPYAAEPAQVAETLSALGVVDPD